MKALYPLIILTLIAVSCGHDSTPIEDKVNNEAPAELELINTINSDSIIETYKRLRLAGGPDGLVISAKTFIDEELRIINFTESIEGYEYPFCLIFNTTNEITSNIQDYDGQYPEIATFVADHLTEPYTILVGNFESTRPYILDPYNAMTLSIERSFRQDINIVKQLYLLKESELIATNLTAITQAIEGDTDYPNGIYQNFTMDEDYGTIVISTTEYNYEGLELIYEISYFDTYHNFTDGNKQCRYPYKEILFREQRFLFRDPKK